MNTKTENAGDGPAERGVMPDGLKVDIGHGRSVAGFEMDDGTFVYLLKNSNIETRVRLSFEAVQAMHVIAHQLTNGGVSA